MQEMNIQRDVNPENDKKLNKMLDAKFGKQSVTIVSADDVRKMQTIIKSLEVLKAVLEKQLSRSRRPTSVARGRQRVRTAARLGLLGTGGRKDPVSIKPRTPSVRQAVGRMGAAIRQTYAGKVRAHQRRLRRR